MITFKKLEWDYWFSYGTNNKIIFTDSVLTQITGKNGAGKTSIPLIVEEILYNKNHKNKKKNKLVNRYVEKPVLKATLEFSKDEDEYIIDLIRKSTVSVTLKKNGVDISSHTATNTYKTIQNIFGDALDFKTFSQLLYQSSTDSLEFLTATDTNRKKFLVSLFNLSKYLEIHEHFKKIGIEINSEISIIKSKLSNVEGWITKNSNVDLTKKEELELPIIDSSLIDKLSTVKSELANIAETNKKISRNLQYKELLKNLDTSILSEVIEINNNIHDIRKKIIELEKEKSSNNTNIAVANSILNKLNDLNKHGDQCPTCLQSVDKEFTNKLKNTNKNIVEHLFSKNKEIDSNIFNYRNIEKEIDSAQKRLQYREKVEREFSDLVSKIDNNLRDTPLEEALLKKEINDLNEKISLIQKDISRISKYNSEVSVNNNKIDLIISQLEDYNKELSDLKMAYIEMSNLYSSIQILKNAFGTNGLISYKLDFLIKDLEYQINNYLEELSGGRFQILFILNDDKLDIEIVDDNMSITIEELSAGELARVNAATLLAIRKLMSSLSSTKINLLFLDEIMGVLDDVGKEKLIDVLYNETGLNTYLVSHEYTHPLIPKINIIKENRISRIEE